MTSRIRAYKRRKMSGIDNLRLLQLIERPEIPDEDTGRAHLAGDLTANVHHLADTRVTARPDQTSRGSSTR